MLKEVEIENDDEFSDLSAWHVAAAATLRDCVTTADSIDWPRVALSSSSVPYRGLVPLRATLYPRLGPRHDWSLRVNGPLSSVGRAFPW
jgi:hypothetical protein